MLLTATMVVGLMPDMGTVKVSAAEAEGGAATQAAGYDNGFCTNYEWKDGSLVLKDGITECNNHTDCNGYQPATLTTGKYDIDGDGDKDNEDVAYAISNAGQLYWFAALVNGTNGLTQDLGANAVLIDDITVNLGVLNENGDLNTGNFRSWTPIGESKFYAGKFDGNNKIISGLYYKEEVNEDDFFYAGLFGKNDGSICNITIEYSYFSWNAGKDAACYLGALVGNNSGEIINCNNAGTVYFVGSVCSVGGICGRNTGKIENCNNGDLDLGVNTNTNNIPAEVINQVTKEKNSLQLSLNHNGDFGFTATLTVHLDAKNKGLYANLYYYNPKAANGTTAKVTITVK